MRSSVRSPSAGQQKAPPAIDQRARRRRANLAGAAVFRNEINRIEGITLVKELIEAFFGRAETDSAAANDEQELDYRTALG